MSDSNDAKPLGQWVKIISVHKCALPDAKKSAANYAVGSVWRCNECNARYTLSHSQRDGHFFVKEYDKS